MSSSGTYRMRVEIAAPATALPRPSSRWTGLYGRPPRGHPLWLGALYLIVAVVMLACVRAGLL